LLAIHRLQEHEADAGSIAKLLEAARRNLADSQSTAISADTRFDAAYKCVMQCAMLGLWNMGYRTSTSQPGHHQTAIQSLGLTMSVPQAEIILLDALRRQRNGSDYAGDPISDAALESCVAEAGKLLKHTARLLEAKKPG